MPVHSKNRTHEIEEEPAWGMYVEWQAAAPVPKVEAAGNSRPRRSSRPQSIGVDKRNVAINKQAKRAPRGTGLYHTAANDVVAPLSPWEGLPVSNKYGALMSPDGEAPSSPAQPAASSKALPAVVPVAAMPAKVASPAKKQVQFTSDKENAAGTPVARRTRAAAKAFQWVVDAVSPGLKRSSLAAFACLPNRIGS
eukprot:scaffold32617_cov126-Isochrysis_galbana.AAC.1